MDKDDGAAIARIDERIIHFGADLASHIANDSERFEKMLGQLKDGFASIETRFDKLEQKAETRLHFIETKMGQLWDDKNSRDGALGLGKWIAGIVGGIIGAACAFLAIPHGGGK
ncbi:MAG: hypothetical protein KGI29_08380 [Pseudomonadota bacterium]|nr:hypothetical protein [Pseudomonadota bacterium]MDE3037121.1 hypothetical protein [Pseudomonadota bacterium]